LANAVRSQFHDWALAVMEATFVLRLTWKKQNSAKLDMLWRYEQYFYSTDGWASGFMMREGSTGLIRVDISNGAR
jgi:hypothetical protein